MACGVYRDIARAGYMKMTQRGGKEMEEEEINGSYLRSVRVVWG